MSQSTTPTSFEGTKSFDSKTALLILKQFYTEVKKEIKKNERAVVSAQSSDDHCNLKFICDGFNLEFSYQEGGEE